MIIYNPQGKEIYNIPVDDSSYWYYSIMGKNDVELRFSMSEHINIPVGSFINYEEERYTLWYPENFKKKGTRNFEYVVTFISWKETLKRYKYKLLSSVPYSLKFTLTATPLTFLQLLVDNLNRNDNGWSVGQCIVVTEKTLAFNCEFCSDVLARLATEFDTEWEIDGKTISLCKVEKFKEIPLPLSYGKGKGFKPDVGRVSQGDKQPCTILYVQGGERNINYATYGSKYLLLPKLQEFTYNGRKYKTDEDGMYITRADRPLTEYVEDGFDGSDFYPKWVGTVTEVIPVDEKGNDIKDENPEEPEEGEDPGEPVDKIKFYDFIDSDIPDDLDYSKCRIAGEKATVIFQSGILSGREFDLVQTDSSLTGYIHKDRRFKLVSQEYDGIMMPAGDTFKINTGDTYAVFNISIPSSYICNNTTKQGASWDMFKAGVRYLYEHEEQMFTFSGEADGIYVKKNWLEIGGRIVTGGYVLFSDPQFQPEGVIIRITGIRTYINNPYSPQLELSNAPVSGTLSGDLGKLESDEVTTDKQHGDSLSFTKRSFRDASETIKMLEKAFLNFSGSIDPITIHTMQLLVGDESLQYRFVNNTTSPETVSCVIKYDSKKKILIVPSGIIQHMTIGIKSVTSEHKPDEYSFWNMPEYNSPKLVKAEQSYYLYAKVSRETQEGDFKLSETGIGMKSDPETYHLLVGILNSEYEGYRSFVELYGFTEVLPGRITTDRIVSSDGLNFLDFVNNSVRVGNDKNYIDFNSKKDGKLRIKGSIIQSDSGDEAPPGCFRGVWEEEIIYFPGDEATYDDGNGVSMYRYIAPIPSSGHLPTDKAYWALVAAGGRPGYDGEDGKGIEFIFKLQNTTNPPEKPESVNEDDNIPEGWTDDQQGVSVFYLYEFVARRVKSGGLWGNYSTPALWARYSFDGEDGSDGKDGTDYEYIFTRTTDNTKPETPESINTNDAIPDGWTDDMKGVNSTYQYEWVSKREKANETWGSFSLPALWARYSFDGVNGDYFEYRFAKNGSRTYPPAIQIDSAEPEGWSTAMPAVGDLEYLWFTIAKKTSIGELLQNWSTPKRLTPADGNDGAPGATAPILAFRGDYNNNRKYYGTPKRVDAIKYNGIHYVSRTDAPVDNDGCFRGHAPVLNFSGIDLYWNEFGAEFESVATNLLLAEYANVGGLILKEGRLISQKGYLNGVDSDDYANDEFIPNIILNGNEGHVFINGFFASRFSTSYNVTDDGYPSTMNFIVNSDTSMNFDLPNNDMYIGSVLTVYINRNIKKGESVRIGSPISGGSVLYKGKVIALLAKNKGTVIRIMATHREGSRIMWELINFDSTSFAKVELAEALCIIDRGATAFNPEMRYDDLQRFMDYWDIL